MPSLSSWRRGVLAAALAVSMLFAVPMSSATAATHVKGWVCHYRWRDSARQVRKTIRCAARRWTVPGGPRKALSVARCESGFDPAAYGSGNAGVFQHALPYWPGRAKQYGFAGRSVYNGRANVIVSIRMAHAGGWDAWACA